MISTPTEIVVPPSHRRPADAVLAGLGTDPGSGLDRAEVARRLESHGPNELTEAERTPTWKRIVAQFSDTLILILIGAAVVAFVVSGEVKTPAVVLVVVVLNAAIGFLQENRAEKSLDALRRMLVTQAEVRRDGVAANVPATELVPGDIVMLTAGDRVPADGRLLVAQGLEIDEAALTGEAQPVVKSTDTVDVDAVGDRTCMAHMNTIVTRGRGEMVVTSTGMATEMGKVADLLRSTEAELTPLQRQLDGLAHSLAKLAGVVVALVFAIGLVRGQSLSDMLLTAVALAVAAIPEGLPAVTAITLAIGVSKMAKRNAIVKHLASVETLGCTSVICSDKTGTLTLNAMSATTFVTQLRRHEVTGTGYAPVGQIVFEPDTDQALARRALDAMALCNNATIRDGELIGDPTEGALVVLAMKAGVDPEALRLAVPRETELPFDSAHKFMATAHRIDGEPTLLAKGAPDVILSRSGSAIDANGRRVPLAEVREAIEETIDLLGSRGLRVLAVAERAFPELDGLDRAAAIGPELVDDLTLIALIGIVDPPRPEVRDAIADAHGAGITVKMITGDHAATASAIAGDLGIHGDVLTGAELDRLDDDELAARIDDVHVFARVAPEHKIRIVDALQKRGLVVAMTGDGVNDAPALKKADIGIAMGITGTEVTKEAATMVLADDNFATIVGAVRRGRGIYDNIVKFVRFQLSTTIGFAGLFLFAALLGIADGKPFTAIAILWVNIVMDGPPALALGLDRPSRDIMQRSPRSATERILTRPRWVAIGLSAAVMGLGTLGVLAWGPGPSPEAGTATVAGTMAFATFVLFQFFNLLNSRSDTLSVFRLDTFTNRSLWLSLAVVLALQVVVTHVGFAQRLFDTTSISLGQWAVCAAIASSVLWTEELRKAVVRATERRSDPDFHSAD